jgi:uncharacterized protein
MPVTVKRLLIDALKPREVSIVELGKALGMVDEKAEVEIVIREVDSRTETIKVTIRGSNIDYKLVSEIMDKNGVSIRGIDEINTSRE